MKKIMVVVIGMIALFVMSGIGQAAESWPGTKPMLLFKLATGDQRCAIYAMPKGSVEVDCATKAGDSWTLGPVAKCMASGVKQVCSSTLEFNSFDTEATKCSKVCGGTGWTKYK